MTNSKIKTKGMHCMSCEMLITDVLEELPGVRKAKATHITGIISVDFNQKMIAEKDIIKIIRMEG